MVALSSSGREGGDETRRADATRRDDHTSHPALGFDPTTPHPLGRSTTHTSPSFLPSPSLHLTLRRPTSIRPLFSTFRSIGLAFAARRSRSLLGIHRTLLTFEWYLQTASPNVVLFNYGYTRFSLNPPPPTSPPTSSLSSTLLLHYLPQPDEQTLLLRQLDLSAPNDLLSTVELQISDLPRTVGRQEAPSEELELQQQNRTPEGTRIKEDLSLDDLVLLQPSSFEVNGRDRRRRGGLLLQRARPFLSRDLR